MALIKCPECGKDISDQAEICIHCGYPIKKNMESQGLEELEDKINVEVTKNINSISGDQSQVEKAEERKKSIRNAIIAIAAVVGGIIVLVAVIEYSQHSYTRAHRAAQQSYSNYQSEKSKLDELEREKSAVDAAIGALESNR